MKKIVYAVVLVTIIFSVYWLWHADAVISQNNIWCAEQKEVYPLEVCGGIAERDVQKTAYLKVLMFSILVFGSTGLILGAKKSS